MSGAGRPGRRKGGVTSAGIATFLAPPPSDAALPPAPPTTSQLQGPHNLSSFAQNPAPKDPFVSLSASLARSSEVVCHRPGSSPPRTAPFPSPSSTSQDPSSRAPSEIVLRLSPPTPLLRYHTLPRTQPRLNANPAAQAPCRLQSALSPNPEPGGSGPGPLSPGPSRTVLQIP